MELAKDQNGRVIPVDFSKDGLVPGALSNVKPFKCCMSLSRLLKCSLVFAVVINCSWVFSGGVYGVYGMWLILAITVRSPQHEAIFRKEWAEAQKVGVDFSHVKWDNMDRM